MTLGGSKRFKYNFMRMIENSSKVDQYYYGARPDVQRAGVQVGRTDRNLDLITFSNN